MVSKGHGTNCDCSECIQLEEEYLVDLSSSINLKSVFCLNESVSDAGRKVFKNAELINDRVDFVTSNEGDPELLFYIPFTSQVNLKNMTMIGGENGTSPLHAKLYVNQDHPDFELSETPPSQEFECIENPTGELAYELKPNKFKSVNSLTLIITRCHDADYSKIYYISFTGVRTKVSL